MKESPAMTILHITRRQDWQAAQAIGSYEADSLRSQGFIHCSTPEQLPRVAETLFRGQDGLVVLTIDATRVNAPIRTENLEGGDERFPHIYGPLNLDAVVAVNDLEQMRLS